MSSGTIARHHSIPVHLSFGAPDADPMHLLFAAKGGVLRMYVVVDVALIVPFKQQWVFCRFKCWLCKLVTTGLNFAAFRTSGIMPHTL